jgi:hypothetical protein
VGGQFFRSENLPLTSIKIGQNIEMDLATTQIFGWGWKIFIDLLLKVLQFKNIFEIVD